MFIVLMLSSLAHASCGNGICEASESHYSCSSDCSPWDLDNYCTASRDSICDPDCRQADPDCPDYALPGRQSTGMNLEQSFTPSTIRAVLLIIGLFSVLYFLYKKIRGHELNSVYEFQKVHQVRFRRPEQQKTKQEYFSEIKKDERFKGFFKKVE